MNNNNHKNSFSQKILILSGIMIISFFILVVLFVSGLKNSNNKEKTINNIDQNQKIENVSEKKDIEANCSDTVKENSNNKTENTTCIKNKEDTILEEVDSKGNVTIVQEEKEDNVIQEEKKITNLEEINNIDELTEEEIKEIQESNK